MTLKSVTLGFLLFFSSQIFAQTLVSNNKALEDAFKLALHTVDMNTRRGILAAGGDYGGEWTRDIAINSWNGASLFRPKVAEESLWSVTINRDTVGHQYWDKVIWVIAAYHHYEVTGDKAFLKQAYSCAVNTLKTLEQQTYDAKYGLFKGPSVFNDGIAGYPEPIYEPANYSSFVLDHKNSTAIKCLSTNAIYYGAYLALVKMSSILEATATPIYQQKATILKNNILKNFYDGNTNSFNYLIDQHGNVVKAQEALGISFAVLFGIIDTERANLLIKNAVVSTYGITSIYPDFPRYAKEKPGRHNQIIWPMVSGFFANAALKAKYTPAFTKELYSLTQLALDEDKGNYNFREIYNPYTGKPDGGWQANGKQYPEYHWESFKHQTWSATAYLAMVMNGVIGLSYKETVIQFTPFLPIGITSLKLSNLAYRNSILDISIVGQGATIKSFKVDGKLQSNASIRADFKGKHSIVIQLGQ